MSLIKCDRHDRFYDSDWDDTCPDCAGHPQYFCGDCDRYEDDPMFIDLEQCSQCGAYITAEDGDGASMTDRERAWDDYGLSMKDFL